MNIRSLGLHARRTNVEHSSAESTFPKFEKSTNLSSGNDDVQSSQSPFSGRKVHNTTLPLHSARTSAQYRVGTATLLLASHEAAHNASLWRISSPGSMMASPWACVLAHDRRECCGCPSQCSSPALPCTSTLQAQMLECGHNADRSKSAVLLN